MCLGIIKLTKSHNQKEPYKFLVITTNMAALIIWRPKKVFFDWKLAEITFPPTRFLSHLVLGGLT